MYTTITSRRLQAAKQAIIALGSDIPKPEFIDLVAGWECFTRTGVALPQETVEYVCLSDVPSSSQLYFYLSVFCVRNVTVHSLDLSGMLL